MADMKLFAGNATPELAKKIAARLYTRLGNATVDRFSDAISSLFSRPVPRPMTT